MKLGELCIKIGSGATPRGGKKSYRSFGIPIIRSQNIHDWTFSSDGLAFLDETQANSLSNAEVMPGDILLNITGDSVARSCMVPQHYTPARVNQHVLIIRPNEMLNPIYLLCFLQRIKSYLLNLASSGATRNALTKGMIENLDIELPSFETQQAIASVIEKFLDKIAINNQINDYLIKVMRTNFKRLFSHQAKTTGSIYDIAEVIYGAAFSSSLFNEEREGFPLMRIRDLTTFDPQVYTTEAHPKKTVINPGDVVAGMDAEFTPTFWLGSPALLNQRVCHFAPPQDSEVTPSYLLFALEPLLQFIQNYATGTTVAHLGKSDLEALEVGVPSYDSLKQFAIIAEPMRWQIVQNSIENRSLSELRDALLSKLMSGEIDVSKVDVTQLNNHLSDCLS